MIKVRTSNFAMHGKTRGAIAISATSPRWFRGPSEPALAPPIEMVMALKRKEITEKEYALRYLEQLSGIDAAALVKGWEKHAWFDGEVTLLCWCASGAFCHRLIVASWLRNELGIEVPDV